MSLIEWNEKFSLGVPAIDHEHQELIELINDAHRAVVAGESTEQVSECLGEIYARISAHFALEEKLMRESAYDEYAGHKADHEQLLDQILDFIDLCEAGGGFDDESFSDNLRDWFAEHFRTRDARLHHRLGH